MPSEVRRLDVLIASPSDAARARDAIEHACHEWNDYRGDAESIVLRPRRWEIAAVPVMGQGDAQSVINTQLVDESDIVFGIFYFRLGTPTARAASGTAEEIDRSIAKGKPVHLYFAEVPMPYDVDIEQLQALRKFRTLMQSKGLAGSFKAESELSTLAFAAIELDIRKAHAKWPAPDTANEESAQLFEVTYIKPQYSAISLMYPANSYEDTYRLFGERFQIQNMTKSAVRLVSVSIVDPLTGQRLALVGDDTMYSEGWVEYRFPGSATPSAADSTSGNVEQLFKPRVQYETLPKLMSITWSQHGQEHSADFPIGP